LGIIYQGLTNKLGVSCYMPAGSVANEAQELDKKAVQTSWV